MCDLRLRRDWTCSITLPTVYSLAFKKRLVAAAVLGMYVPFRERGEKILEKKKEVGSAAK